MGILCIRRTLAHGRLNGIATGLGVATADAIYASLAAFGLTLLTDLLLSAKTPTQLFGGLFLAYLGVRTFSAPPAETAAAAADGRGLFGAFSSALILGITNPATILMFAGIFATLASAASEGACAGALVAGIFVGSLLWWAFLTGAVTLVRGRLNGAWLRWVNRLSGVVLVAFAMLALVSLLTG